VFGGTQQDPSEMEHSKQRKYQENDRERWWYGPEVREAEHAQDRAHEKNHTRAVQ